MRVYSLTSKHWIGLLILACMLSGCGGVSRFSRQKGKLPLPIIGLSYLQTHYGKIKETGGKNVFLFNKGVTLYSFGVVNACAVYKGRVSKIFLFNGLYNIIIRHKHYLSVYCNLANTYVRVGESVQAYQPIGQVEEGRDGKSILYFQLRKERQLLNPEEWLRW